MDVSFNVKDFAEVYQLESQDEEDIIFEVNEFVSKTYTYISINVI